MALLEIAVQDLDGVRVARTEGANRLELCTGLVTGGLTPSRGLIEAAVAAAGPVGVHVLIRPRTGDFVFDEAERAVMMVDVRDAVACGVRGVVVGALTADGHFDLPAFAELKEAAGEIEVTCHRAIDQVISRHGVQAGIDGLAQLADIGIDRVLTSGGAARAIDGIEVISAIVQADLLEVMAGGGVRAQDISALVAIGADAVHLSASTMVSSPAGPGASGTRQLTDGALVAGARRALDQPD